MRHAMIVTVALLLLAGAARAERAATQPGELATPKKALKYFDRMGTDPKIDRATLFYAATTEDEKKVASAFAGVDLALAKLRKRVAARFDRAAGDAIVHALHDVTADDIDAAEEKIDGNTATVSGKNFGDPLPMVKVDGVWKISIKATLARSTVKPDELIDLCSDIVEAIERTDEEISADKYANPSLLERAVKRRVRGILGGE